MLWDEVGGHRRAWYWHFEDTLVSRPSVCDGKPNEKGFTGEAFKFKGSKARSSNGTSWIQTCFTRTFALIQASESSSLFHMPTNNIYDLHYCVHSSGCCGRWNSRLLHCRGEFLDGRARISWDTPRMHRFISRLYGVYKASSSSNLHRFTQHSHVFADVCV